MRRALLVVTVALGAVFALRRGVRIVLRRQAAIARRRIGKPLGEQSIDANRVWQQGRSGPSIRLVMLGDSLAAGLGANRRKETLGARLSKGIAQELGRPVTLRIGAIVGSESSALYRQVDAIPEQFAPDLAVIVVGGNDVTHRVPTLVAANQLSSAIRRLRARGASVVVGTCPDLGSLRPVPQPLRLFGSRMSARLASAQQRVALKEGAIPVDLRRAVGRLFRDHPDDMFSVDRFHPSPLGYRRMAEVMLPAVLDALMERGLSSPHKEQHDPVADAEQDYAQPQQ